MRTGRQVPTRFRAVYGKSGQPRTESSHDTGDRSRLSLAQRILVLAALPLLCLSAAVAAQQQGPGDAPPVYRDPGQPVDRRVEDLLERMTLEEKAAQLVSLETKSRLIEPTGEFSPEKATKAFPHGLGQLARPSDSKGMLDANGKPYPGGQGGRSARNTAEFTNAAQRWAVESTRLGIPMFTHEEALHGYAAKGATSFPQAIALAGTFNPDLVERVFSVAGAEMRARGANLALSPVIDIARDPRWGRIEETYGEDPYLVGETGLAAIRGLQGTTLPLAPDKVLVTLKHMTGHGQPEGGSNTAPADLSERTVREMFLPPFERAVKELPVRSIMASYNEIGGVPSHANGWLLNEVLRNEWGYTGMVISDYHGIGGLVGQHRLFSDLDDAAIRALSSGVDVETPDDNAYSRLVGLVRAGEVDETLVDQAVRRVLRTKFEAGLFEHPYVDAAAAEGLTNTAASIQLARSAAQQAIVLLKNEGNLLPLDADAIGKMLIVGTHANDTPIGGYSDQPTHVVSVLEGMRAAAAGKFSVDYAEGVRLTESRDWFADSVQLVPPEINRRLIAEAVERGRLADVIVVVLGDNEQTSREAWAPTHLGDRSSLELIGQQQELADALLALGKPIVFVMLNGRPLAITELADAAPAILEGWYLGEQTGNAVADVILGKYNPGAKLPVSIPRSVGQIPVFYNHRPSARREYLFDTTAPLYPFGYGLSYTTFDISAPRLAKATIRPDERAIVSVDVTNTGSRTGDEVVQLYVQDEQGSVTRPVLQLAGFRRVTLKPGESRTLTFELGAPALALWNLDMERVVEPGTFTILAGPNSTDLKKTELTVSAS